MSHRSHQLIGKEAGKGFSGSSSQVSSLIENVERYTSDGMKQWRLYREQAIPPARNSGMPFVIRPDHPPLPLPLPLTHTHTHTLMENKR